MQVDIKATLSSIDMGKVSALFANQGAILLESGAGQGSTPAPWGTILVGAPFLRHKNFTSAAGTASYPVPMTSSMVGQTLNWMWIIRDPGPTGAIAHHSAGLEITFCQ